MSTHPRAPMSTPPSPRSASRFGRLPSAAAAALAMLLSLPACSLTPLPPSEGGAPLPPGWTQETWPSRPRPVSTPPWGVPSFEPPSATHCQGPQRLREQPGRGGQIGGRAAESGSTTSPRFIPAPMSAAVTTPDTSAVGPPPILAPMPAPMAKARAADESRGVASAGAAPPAQGNLTRMPPQPQPQPQTPRPAEVVSAGMVDDNAAFADYQAYRARSAHLNPRDRDSAERYRIEVRDASGRPAIDAEVALSWPGAAQSLRFARTDGAGQVWLHPRALLAPELLGRLTALEVQVRSRSGEVQRAALQRGQKPALQLQLRQAETPLPRTPLDLVFLVDATGSMADEIHKLRDSLRSIADRVGALPSQPDLCWGMVAYRDRGDAFLTRTHDLTDDLGAFQQSLARLQATGGGDYPEALNEALDETVHRISWRTAGTSRLVILVADAPPHLDRGGPYHDEGAAAALARGIKLHAVGASGLDKQGEAIFRQMAQSTGGRFVFLTYRDANRPSSGAGSQTVHDVRDYSVDTLDELIVRLVREELAQR